MKKSINNKSLIRIEKKLLHYVGKAISDYKMINNHDKILVCLSGGKDSFTMLILLKLLQLKAKMKFELFVFVLDSSAPNWDDTKLREYLKANKINFEVLKRNIYKVVRKKISDSKNFCSLCSRLRRGNIYQYAKDNGFNKIALGHHREDLIQTLLMSILYNGEIRTMPPKLLTDDKAHIVIRPLAYCQEKDIIEYAKLKSFPIIENYCDLKSDYTRRKIANLIKTLSLENPKIPSNMLHALKKITPSHLMDKKHWDFFNIKIE